MKKKTNKLINASLMILAHDGDIRVATNLKGADGFATMLGITLARICQDQKWSLKDVIETIQFNAETTEEILNDR